MFEFGGISSFYGLNDQILPLRPSSYWLETFLFSLIVLSHAHDLIDKRSSLTTYGIAGKYCAFVKQRYIYVVTPDCFNEHELTIFLLQQVCSDCSPRAATSHVFEGKGRFQFQRCNSEFMEEPIKFQNPDPNPEFLSRRSVCHAVTEILGGEEGEEVSPLFAF